MALAVAANIVVTGARLVRRSIGGLMNRALDDAAHGELDEVLSRFRPRGMRFHALRTPAGRPAGVPLHVLVPGAWSVQGGHDLVEEVEAAVLETLPYATVFTHLEPIEDDRSFDDRELSADGPACADPARSVRVT